MRLKFLKGLLLFIVLTGSFSIAIFTGCKTPATAPKTDTVAIDPVTLPPPPDSVIHLTSEEFKRRVIDYTQGNAWKYLGDKPCVLDFHAHWCGPCRMISPFLDQLAKEYAGQIYIYKINIDYEKEVASVFDARSIPLLVFIPMQGQPQAIRGAVPKETIQQVIDSFLLGKK